MSLYFMFVLAQTPTQTPAPSKNTVGIGADKIIKGALDGSRAAYKLFNQDWQDLISNNSEIYKTVVAISLLIAVVLVSFWSIGWYLEIVNNGISTNVINQMVYPVVVILMLSVNNGALLANTSLMFRDISNGLNDKVLDMTRNGISLRNAIQVTNVDQSLMEALNVTTAVCQEQPEEDLDENGDKIFPRDNCIKQKQQEAIAAAEKYRKDNNLPNKNSEWNILKGVGEFANSAVQVALRLILSGVAAAFQYVIEISFLMNAYIGPLFLVLSLLPLGAKPIYAWLSGWFALGLLMISYSIIVGISASSIVNTDSSNPLVHQLMAGIFSPILAVAIATGGGLAVFSGVTSSARLIFSAIKR